MHWTFCSAFGCERSVWRHSGALVSKGEVKTPFGGMLPPFLVAGCQKSVTKDQGETLKHSWSSPPAQALLRRCSGLASSCGFCGSGGLRLLRLQRLAARDAETHVIGGFGKKGFWSYIQHVATFHLSISVKLVYYFVLVALNFPCWPVLRHHNDKSMIWFYNFITYSLVFLDQCHAHMLFLVIVVVSPNHREFF